MTQADTSELRWYKLSEAEPSLAEVILIKINDPDPEDLPVTVICFGVDETEFDYWFPIIPWPKG